jgi:ABC-type glycerol-3-phosphate transport system substrate-binding protein
MKKILALVIAGIAVLSLAACGGDATTPTDETTTEVATELVTE